MDREPPDPVITPADQEALEQLVGTATFERGSGYAHGGAVRNRTWSPGGTRVVGEVQGGAARPYVASVELTRSATQELADFQATCTCPVGVNCKHAVALVLADDPDDAGPVTTRPTLTLVQGDGPAAHPSRSGRGAVRGLPEPSDPEHWALPLEALLGADDEAGPAAPLDDPEAAEIALLFELTLGAMTSARRSGSATPGIRVRPVVPGRSGNWVKGGISWSGLDYFAYGRTRSPRLKEQLALVKELLALSQLSSRPSNWGYQDETVRLESINSRRLWDLLGEARGLGLPLLQSGRSARAVALLPVPAAVTIDVTRTDTGLRAEPRIGTDALRLPLETSMLIGRPAHGIAWWEEQPAPSGGTQAVEPGTRRPRHPGRRRPPGLPAHRHGRRAPSRRGAIPPGPGAQAPSTGGSGLERRLGGAARGAGRPPSSCRSATTRGTGSNWCGSGVARGPRAVSPCGAHGGGSATGPPKRP